MCFCVLQVAFLTFHPIKGQYNPTILQDSRDLPKVDGRFGFLYRTEDGISHGAKSEGDGVVQGRYTYTDPTGLKVNFNYNAGTKRVPGYNYDEPIDKYMSQIPYNSNNNFNNQNNNNYNNNYNNDYNNNQNYNYESQDYNRQTYSRPESTWKDNNGDFYVRSQPRSRTRPPSRNDIY